MKEEARIRAHFKKYRRANPMPFPVVSGRKYFGDATKEVFIVEPKEGRSGFRVRVVQLIRRDKGLGRQEEWLRFGCYDQGDQNNNFRFVPSTSVMVEKSRWLRLKQHAERADIW